MLMSAQIKEGHHQSTAIGRSYVSRHAIPKIGMQPTPEMLQNSGDTC